MNDPNKAQRERYIEARDSGTLNPTLIKDIDYSTVWEEKEPIWWLEMMETYRGYFKD